MSQEDKEAYERIIKDANRVDERYKIGDKLYTGGILYCQSVILIRDNVCMSHYYGFWPDSGYEILRDFGKTKGKFAVVSGDEVDHKLWVEFFKGNDFELIGEYCDNFKISADPDKKLVKNVAADTKNIIVHVRKKDGSNEEFIRIL